MPFIEIKLKPGVNIEPTEAGNMSGVQTSNFIRWRADLPEKRGGCSLYLSQQLEGYPSSLRTFGDLEGNAYLGIATDQNVYSYNSVAYNNINISPDYFDTDSSSVTFSSVANTSRIVITDLNVNSSNLHINDSVQFNVPVSVGGVILYQTYRIVDVSDTSPGQYTIDVGYNAASTQTNVAANIPKFSTTADSTKVKVTFPINYQFNNLVAGNLIGFSIPTDVGGLKIVGQYVVIEIIDANNFYIKDDQTASSTQTNIPMNSGNVNLRYWITLNPPSISGGYGLNTYGQYGYGVGALTPPPVNPVTKYTAKRWFLENIGSTLIASAVGGPIFSWSTAGGYGNLSVLANGPSKQNGAFVAMPQGQIMAWGCNDAIDPVQNPLYIRWSDSTGANHSFTNWTIGGQSLAGFYVIPTGSKIMRGLQANTVQYWFTDIDLYTAQYTGYPNYFGFTKTGSGCGLIAPQAVAAISSSVFWMSEHQFFMSQAGSAPQPIPCTVWDFVFQNLDQNNKENIVAGANSTFNEVSWFFPSTESSNGVPDSYVCYNILYNVWDFGKIERTAWVDQSIIGPPIAADSSGWVYQHETSNNLAVGQQVLPISSQLTTGYYSISNGQDLSFVDWVLPDFKWGQYNQAKNARLGFTFYVTDYAGQTPRSYGPYYTTKETDFISPRFRGRYVSIKIENDNLDSFWRLGSIRLRLAPSGRR